MNLSSSLDLSSSQESQLTSELSSGLRVSSLSVDPTAVAQSALLDTAISQEDTYVQTASGETSRLQAADSALGEVVTQVTSAVSLAVSAGNGTLSSSDLSSVQQQLTAVRDSVLALANTSYGGTYLFSGSQGTTKPFAIDTSTVPATTTYSGDSVTQSVVTPTGQSIQVNLPGAAVFGSVLGALNQLIADFSGTGVSATVATDGAALTTALGQVSTQRSVLDSSLSTLESTSTYTQTQAANATNAQSTLMSADTATVATQLSAAETQHQALLSVISGLEQATDLFGYLH
nr:flagellar hook-associated protein FlgL [Granulicella arctica]